MNYTTLRRHFEAHFNRVRSSSPIRAKKWDACCVLCAAERKDGDDERTQTMIPKVLRRYL
jgi:hypothetical protein